MDYQLFSEAMNLLKNHSIQKIREFLPVFERHLSLVLQEYANSNSELKRLLSRYIKLTTQMNRLKQQVEQNVILPWVPTLKKMQTTSMFPETKVETLTRIVEGKKELENIDHSISEMKLKVMERARTTKTIFTTTRNIETQILVMKTAIEVKEFFEQNRLNVEFADYETRRYYDWYVEKRGGDGNG